MKNFLQRLIGYSLVDGNAERLFLMVSGKTSSGKSTLNEVLLATLGGYARPFNLSAFRANQNERPRPDIAEILNRRYVSAVEASSEWRLRADQIKRLTGGDTLAARFPWDRMNTVRVPAFVPFIFTNAVPTVIGRDKAMDRRVLVLPFDQTVSGSAERKHAREEMKRSSDTHAAVLAWAVQGLKEYWSDGLGPLPKAVAKATKRAQGGFSDLDRFVSECCHEGREHQESPQGLYSAYVRWCGAKNILERDRLTATAFGTALENRGFARKRSSTKDSDGQRPWTRQGLCLKKRGATWDQCPRVIRPGVSG